MILKDFFAKDIQRNINGVIKVGQLGEADKHTELEEYVMTRELSAYFDKFYGTYISTLEDPTGNIGVWIAGFFGSGKSHFLKILSYLLENETVMGQKALDYFAPKVEDAVLFANMQRASEVTSDVILFNIDSRADAESKLNKEAIVNVFMKVFNDHLGYFGTAPEIADFERRLSKQGQYEDFQASYKKHTNKDWADDRENWDFQEDEIVAALQESLHMSEESARRFFDNIGENYSLSSQRFAKIVNEYLQTKPNGDRLIFMVDEVGQYIGENTNLMLNLQTVAEDLNTYCEGRAWVAVTSQEDMDTITKDRVKGNDFSKIQGRFKTRFSLSSSNTDEVIKLRLLKKTQGARDALEAYYPSKEQVLRNQIRFSTGTAHMPGFGNKEEFVQSYPFVPYQFGLLQKVFTQVRIHGASGKHLAEGARSMLDAFQIAARKHEDKALGVLVPFSDFYDAMAGFLDNSIKTVIGQAAENEALEAFDVELLKTLFMIKYVKEIKGTPENLTTLSLRDVEENRLELSARIEASLNRLERETLIQRTGDAFEFLTNEEQDVGKEIKNTQVLESDVTKKLQTLIWEEVYSQKKYRYKSRYDYAINKMLDGLPYGQQTGDLTLHIITPESDLYSDLKEDDAAVMRTGNGSEALVRLPEERAVFTELNTLVKTERYLQLKHRDGLSPNLTRILSERADENRTRESQVREALENLVSRADIFVKGDKLNLSGSARDVLNEGLARLVSETFNKLDHVKSPFNSDSELEGVLASSVLQTDADGNVPNHLAHDAMLRWLDEQQKRNLSVTLKELETTFTTQPYGWTPRDVQGVLLELAVQGKVELKHAQAPVDLKTPDLISKMWRRSALDAYTVRAPQPVNPEDLRMARELATEHMLMANVPTEPQLLFESYIKALKTKLDEVTEYHRLAQPGYPFRAELEAQGQLLKSLTAQADAATFFSELRNSEAAFDDLMDAGEDIKSFYSGQLSLFEKTQGELKTLEADLTHLNDAVLSEKVARAREILATPNPVKAIPDLGGLLEPVDQRLAAIKSEQQENTQKSLQAALQAVSAFAKDQKISDESLFKPLLALETAIAQAPSIDAVIARQRDIQARKMDVMDTVIQQANAAAKTTDKTTDAPQTVAKPIKTFRTASAATKTLLESEEDVNRYTDDLKEQLLKSIRAGHRLHLE